jgi:hypothetical protein
VVTWLEALEMTYREILADIHALEQDLLEFERKYGLRSETFYPAYMNGEEPEDDSWTLDFGLRRAGKRLPNMAIAASRSEIALQRQERALRNPIC